MKTSLRRAATPQHRSRPRRNDWPDPKTPSSGEHPRRRFLGLAAGAAALPAVSRIASAQTYPTRPITMIIPIAAGSASDVIGRVLVERMRVSLGQPIIIENVSGADGSIGVGRAARAKPDGYTIVLGFHSSHVLNAAFYSLPYDVLNDFAPISPLVAVSYVLFARKTMPAKNLNDLIAWLRANPNKASAGITSVGFRVLNVFFQNETGTQFTLVPYRGTPPAMQDLLAGQIDLWFGSTDQLPLVRAGSIKAFAVTGDKRLTLAPDIPTFAEMGLPAVSYAGWLGLFAPRGTPKEVIGKLNAAAVDALADPAVRSRLADLGNEVFPREQQTPEALGAEGRCREMVADHQGIGDQGEIGRGVRFGSISATELRDPHGRTCSDTGRQRSELPACGGLSQLSMIGRFAPATGVPSVNIPRQSRGL
jgi:tripartite-type tricarboxylate transporter receptor subunit TctC